MAGLTELDIFLSKTHFGPGDEVKGSVTLSSDKVIKCKKLSVVFEGRMNLRGRVIGTVGKSGISAAVPKSIDTVTQSIAIHQVETLILEETSLDPGKHKFVLRFKVPGDAEISYEGNVGNIRYTLTTLLNLPWKRKVTSRNIPIRIFEYVDDVPDDVTTSAAEHDDEKILEVEIDSQKYCIGQDITFRYRVITDMNFKELRARIEHIENTFGVGSLPMETSSVLCERKIPRENDALNEWRTMTFETNKQFPPWLRHEKLESYLVLKVSLTRSFRIDKSAKIELFSGPCLKWRR